MRFEESPSPKHRHRLIVEGHEVITLSAVYRERIFRLAAAGKLTEIKDFHAIVANWPLNMEESWIDTDAPESIAQDLEAFHQDTPEAILEIPMLTSEPAFGNYDIPKRYSLGKAAIKLADDIRTFNMLSSVEDAADEESAGNVAELPSDQSAN